MLKNKKIILIELQNATHLYTYFSVLQADVSMYEVCTLNTALPLSLAAQADYVVIEINNEKNMELARMFAKNAPLSRIIVITSADKVKEVVATNIQIHALISATYTFDEFLTCFWQLSEGYFYFSKELELPLKREQVASPSQLDFFKTLSQREREVISLLSEGLTNRQISESLFISPETVKNHKKNIIQKLNLTSNNDLLLFVGKLPQLWREQLKIAQ